MNDRNAKRAENSRTDLDEALNELGMLSTVKQSRRDFVRQSWLKRTLKSPKGNFWRNDNSWYSTSSSLSSSSSRKSFSSSSSSGSSSYSNYSRWSSLSHSIPETPIDPIMTNFKDSICASLDLVNDQSPSYKLDHSRVIRRHIHNQCFKPYSKPRRFSLQMGIHKEEPDSCILKGLSLSDSEGSPSSGTGTPPPSIFSQDYRFCSTIASIYDKENNSEVRSNPNSPLRHSILYYNSLPLKSQQQLLKKAEEDWLVRSKSLDDLTLQAISPTSQEIVFNSTRDIEKVLQKISKLEV